MQNTKKSKDIHQKLKKITKSEKNAKKQNICIYIHEIDIFFVFCNLNLSVVFCG